MHDFEDLDMSFVIQTLCLSNTLDCLYVTCAWPLQPWNYRGNQQKTSLKWTLCEPLGIVPGFGAMSLKNIVLL